MKSKTMRIKKAVCASFMTAALFLQGIASSCAMAAEPAEGEEKVEATSAEPEEEAQQPVAAASYAKVGGWFESIYAEIPGVSDADVTAVSYSGTVEGSLTGDDLTYLVRDMDGGVRIDIPAVPEGTYTLSVTAAGQTITASEVKVEAYDRSGYAHFNYTDGVGAYKDDGTLKDNAIVLYVTDENKNSVELSYGSKSASGIGNILSGGMIQTLADNNIPLVVRFIGCVSESGNYKMADFDASGAGLIDGLSEYKSGSDNGHMATIKKGKSITLEGIGSDAVIDGWGFGFSASNAGYGKGFEVRNLCFINTAEDAVGMEGKQSDNKSAEAELTVPVERCWVHNNEFYRPSILNPAEDDKGQGDGSVDFKRGQYFTCSYNYFAGCHKTHLVGAEDTNLQYNLSYHHNYWFVCDSRGPLTRRANVHMYNNIYEMQTSYCQNTRADAYIFSEYNLFYACKDPKAVKEGTIKTYNDSISGVVWSGSYTQGVTVSDRSEKVDNNCAYAYGSIDYSSFDTRADLSYIPDGNYELQTDFTQLRKVIAAGCGVMDAEPKQAADVTAEDYSVIDRSGATVQSVASLPYQVTPGKQSNAYAFTVAKAFDLEVAYDGASLDGVLVNEAGENLLTGAGSVKGLPAGTYMLQPYGFNTTSYSDGSSFVSWKSFTISALKLTETTEVVETSYSVKFDAKGGTTSMKDTTAKAGAVIGLSDCVPAEGFVFKGWSIDGSTLLGSSYTVKAEDAVNGVITIIALYEEVEEIYYTLRFEYNYDNAPAAVSQNVAADTSYASLSELKPAAFARNGYTLEGLYSDAACTKAVSYPYKVSADATFYAKWIEDTPEEVSYSVKFDAKGGTTSMKDTTAKAGAVISLSDCVPAEGFVFKGWSIDGSSLLGKSYTVKAEDAVNGVITIIALYEKKEEEGDEPAVSEGLHIALANPGETYVYTGLAIKPEVIVSCNGEKLIEGTDYVLSYRNNVKAAKAADKKAPTIIVKGKGSLSGKAQASFTIGQCDIADVEMDDELYVTSGAKALPVMAYGGISLTKKDYDLGSDAAVKFTADKDGQTITISGKGNFCGSRTVSVKVVEKKELKKLKVTMGSTSLVYSAGEQKPEVSVCGVDGTQLTEGTDYLISYPENVTDAGTKKMVILGLNAYAGSYKKTYRIQPLKTGSVTCVPGFSSAAYDPNGVRFAEDELSVTIADAELVNGKDYTVKYANNKSAGTAKYTVSFKGNYKGTASYTGNFTIEKANLKDMLQSGDLEAEAADKAVKKAAVSRSLPYLSLNKGMVKNSDLQVKYYTDEACTKEMNAKNPADPAGETAVTVDAGDGAEKKYVSVYAKICGKGKNIEAGEENGIVISYKVWLAAADRKYDMAKVKLYAAKDNTLLKTMPYTGSEIDPGFTVSGAAGQLEDTMFEADILNNRNKGKAFIIVNPAENGAYTGGKVWKFKITSAKLQETESFSEDMQKLFTAD